MSKITAKTKENKIKSFLASRIGSSNDPKFMFDMWWSDRDNVYEVRAYLVECVDDRDVISNVNFLCSAKTLRDAMYKMAMVMMVDDK